jgi:hypothetical protein
LFKTEGRSRRTGITRDIKYICAIGFWGHGGTVASFVDQIEWIPTVPSK